MIISATQTNVTVTPRKLRLVAYAIRKEKPQTALLQLTYLNKEAARVLVKVLKQALANAKNNAQVSTDDLRFKEIIISKGRVLKRGLASARGRSKPYKHQHSHVTIKLATPETTKAALPPRGGRTGSSVVKAAKSVAKKPIVKKAVKKVIKKTTKK